MPDGEARPRPQSVAGLHGAFARAIDRAATILRIRGGVVGDVAGIRGRQLFARHPHEELRRLRLRRSIARSVKARREPGRRQEPQARFTGPRVIADPLVSSTLRRREFRPA